MFASDPLIDERTPVNSANLAEFQRIYYYFIDHYSDHKANVLDYGCGTGYGTDILAKKYSHVVGADVDVDTIIGCKQNFRCANLDFIQLTPHRQPFPNETFGYICSFQVLEHIKPNDALEYLNNIWRMLKPGGIALVTTPRSENYQNGHSGNLYHIKEYTFSELNALIRSSLIACNFSISVIPDVLPTRIHHQINRFFSGNYVARLFARTIAIFLRFANRLDIVRYSDIKLEDHGLKTPGSYLALISKPL